MAYQLDTGRVADLLHTDLHEGLDPTTADRCLEQVGPNEVPLPAGVPWWRILLRQFWSPLVAVLAIGAVLAYVYHDPLNAYAILLVLLLNAGIGFYMDWQARRTIRSLQQLETPSATVLRGGKLLDVPARSVVPGDLLRLEAGQRVPADARVVSQVNLGVDESSLTGESGIVTKQTEPLSGPTLLADRRDMLHAGTIVTRGNATALVTQTGTNTELGRGLHLLHTVTERTTPLEQKLARLTHRLIGFTALLALLLVGLGLYRGMPVYEVVETAIALTVAAIPEGLPVVATITLAIGMSRLSRHHIVIRELRAVETLGETQVLFVDKTGTLTENKLTVESLTQTGTISAGGAGLRKLLRTAVLCNNASVEGAGDPVEVAMLRYAQDQGTEVADIRRSATLLAELPFSSESRSMTTVHRLKEDTTQVVVTSMKGAPGVVLDHCTDCVDENGKSVPLDADWWRRQVDARSNEGLKCLALAYWERDKEVADYATGLSLLGLVWLNDPPRQDVYGAIAQFRSAGIQLVMATGDHAGTARSIALATGVIEDADAGVLEGGAVEKAFADSEVPEGVFDTAVFARVTPAQKLQVLRSYQSRGYVAAMVGDGVNDAPALRQADIGIAMGEGGSEAAKEAADIVLRDNSLANVVEAVRQGRGIFANIRLFTIYLLSCNLAELMVVGSSFLVGFTNPLTPLQILFLNLLTDVFPALALGFTATESDVLKRPPRARSEAILTPRHWWAIGVYALAITVAVMGSAAAGLRWFSATEAQQDDLLFYTLASAQLWHVLSLEGPRSKLFNNPVVRNPYLGAAVVLCVLLIVVANVVTPVRVALQLEVSEEPWVFLLAAAFGLLPVLMLRMFGRIESRSA